MYEIYVNRFKFEELYYYLIVSKQFARTRFFIRYFLNDNFRKNRYIYKNLRNYIII